MGILDVVGRLPDPALRLVQRVAEAVVEAQTVERDLSTVVAGLQARVPDRFIQRRQYPEPVSRLRSPLRLLAGLLASTRASVALFVAPQAFSAAFRTLPRVRSPARRPGARGRPGRSPRFCSSWSSWFHSTPGLLLLSCRYGPKQPRFPGNGWSLPAIKCPDLPPTRGATLILQPGPGVNPPPGGRGP